jgi:hypothetical protein
VSSLFERGVNLFRIISVATGDAGWFPPDGDQRPGGGFRMRRVLSLGMIGGLALAAAARGDDAAKAEPAPAVAQAAQPAADRKAAATPTPDAKAAEESKLLSAVREALERNAQEIKALKEQYAKDMAAQREQIAAQQKKIEMLERSARPNENQPREGQAAGRQQELSEIQRKQLKLLEEQSQLVADELEKQAPVLEKLRDQTATLESRSKQAALRDRELADAHDSLLDSVDSRQRNPPWLPSQLKELFLTSGTNVTQFSVYNTLSTRYDLFQNRKGAGTFAFEEYTPFLLIQLNKRILLSAETAFSQGGVSLGQAQLDFFINDWLTADIGYFLTPIGFWSERLDPRWINKLPDIPLVMRQVIPDGLTTTGLQFRGARYLFRSPFKLEYSAYMTNGLGVPGMGQAADWADLSALTGTTSGVNSAMAYGGRIGLWVPAYGINFGISEFVNAPYSKTSGAVVSVWDPYFNYHRGNWDIRFEYGQNFERTKPFIGNNINRTGLYTQVAYRNYQSLHKHLQRLEYVFRYSEAHFRGIDQAKLDPTTFSAPQNAPLNRNQYTLGMNYYFYPSAFLKIAYEINSEVHRSLRDNVFMMQLTTNF